MSVPQHLQPFLASSDVNLLDKDRDKNYILQNLLHKSDWKAWKWMMKNYSVDDILAVVNDSRSLTPRDKAIWQTYYKFSK